MLGTTESLRRASRFATALTLGSLLWSGEIAAQPAATPPAPPSTATPPAPPSTATPPATAPPGTPPSTPAESPAAAPPPAQAQPPAAPPAAPPPPPGAYPPPPGYTLDYDPERRRERERRRDLVIDYIEGQPVPPGYTVIEQRRKGLIITGSILFGVSYGISLAVAAGSEYSDEYGWLALPVAGPIIASTRLDSCEGDDFNCEDQGTERGFLMLDTLVQAAGATMFLVGLAVPKKVMVQHLDSELSLVPMLSPRTQGVQLLGHF